jgi:hypothetical protein
VTGTKWVRGMLCVVDGALAFGQVKLQGRTYIGGPSANRQVNTIPFWLNTILFWMLSLPLTDHCRSSSAMSAVEFVHPARSHNSCVHIDSHYNI